MRGQVYSAKVVIGWTINMDETLVIVEMKNPIKDFLITIYF